MQHGSSATPTLGEVLRDARFRYGLSLEQAAEDTKIRKRFLAALEDGEYHMLPAPVYARGFIRTYAEYLGIDPHVAEKLFQPTGRAAAPPPIRPAANGLREVRVISMGMVLTFIVAVLIVAGIVYLYAQYQSYTASGPVDFSPRPTATAVVPTVQAAPVVVPTAAPTPTPIPSPTAIRGVEVVVQANERCWIRVVVDNQTKAVFEGELQAGETRTWKANDRMDMRVGNAGGVEVTVNGMRQGKLGASGEVKNITWGRQ